VRKFTSTLERVARDAVCIVIDSIDCSTAKFARHRAAIPDKAPGPAGMWTTGRALRQPLRMGPLAPRGAFVRRLAKLSPDIKKAGGTLAIYTVDVTEQAKQGKQPGLSDLSGRGDQACDPGAAMKHNHRKLQVKAER
jgi:hypothetical protein